MKTLTRAWISIFEIIRYMCVERLKKNKINLKRIYPLVFTLQLYASQYRPVDWIYHLSQVTRRYEVKSMSVLLSIEKDITVKREQQI